MSSPSPMGDQAYGFSPLPQEDGNSEISSFSLELPLSTMPVGHESRAAEGGGGGGYFNSFSVTETQQVGDEILTSDFRPSQADGDGDDDDDDEPAAGDSYACYAKLAFLALVISFSYTIITSDIPSPAVSFNPNSFAISNFTIFYSRLAANWEADFTFGCQNCDNNNLEPRNDDLNVIYYDYIVGYVFYLDREDHHHHHVLSKVSIEPLNLGPKEHNKTVHVKFGNTGWDGDQPIVRKEVVNEISKQVEHGTLKLGMKLSLWVTYKKWGSFWKASLLELPDSYCWDLLVGMMPETGRGKLILSSPKNCYK